MARVASIKALENLVEQSEAEGRNAQALPGLQIVVIAPQPVGRREDAGQVLTITPN